MARMMGSALGPVLGFSNWALSPLHPTPAPPTLPVKGMHFCMSSSTSSPLSCCSIPSRFDPCLGCAILVSHHGHCKELRVVHADAVKPIPATPETQLDDILHRLDGNKQAWVDLPDGEKAKLLRRCIKSTIAVRLRPDRRCLHA